MGAKDTLVQAGSDFIEIDGNVADSLQFDVDIRVNSDALVEVQNDFFRTDGNPAQNGDVDNLDVLSTGMVLTGDDGFGALLLRSNFLINLLPLTSDTENLLDATAFDQLPQGAFLINAGRGDTLVDADLIAALDNGQLAGAALDVFRTEPLPPEHAFWRHPAIWITPHAAAPSDQEASARCIARNIRRVMNGEAPYPVVDRSKGY